MCDLAGWWERLLREGRERLSFEGGNCAVAATGQLGSLGYGDVQYCFLLIELGRGSVRPGLEF
jgi:hypothetical protein